MIKLSSTSFNKIPITFTYLLHNMRIRNREKAVNQRTMEQNHPGIHQETLTVNELESSHEWCFLDCCQTSPVTWNWEAVEHHSYYKWNLHRELLIELQFLHKYRYIPLTSVGKFRAVTFHPSDVCTHIINGGEKYQEQDYNWRDDKYKIEII